MRKISLAVMLVSLLASTGVHAGKIDQAEIKELVLEAILENPEVVLEAIQLLDQREKARQAAEAAAAVAENRSFLENDPNAPFIGNPEGDVVVVEFFDYNCPYCRRAKPELEGLLAQDPNVKIVFREWPILGEGSVFAARAALASQKQGKYEEFHWAMMGASGRIGEETVIEIATEVGLDVTQLRADMSDPAIDEHIEASMATSQSLGFTGTPSFMIGNSLVPGLVDAEKLVELVELVRKDAE